MVVSSRYRWNRFCMAPRRWKKRRGTLARIGLLGMVLVSVVVQAGEPRRKGAAKPTPPSPPPAAPKAPPASERRTEPIVKEADTAADGIQRRVIGSLIFPEKGEVTRDSSALKILTPEVREIIRKALQYVKSSQQSDGCWGDKSFPKSSGVTALACMALLAEGSLPRVGPSGKELDNGIAFLLSCAKEDGLIVAKDTYEMGPMYDHTWATFVLLQCYGNCPWYPDMRAKISRAIQATLRAQKPDGGWRYAVSPMGTSDVSVTCSAMLLIRLARMAGFAVPEERIVKAQEFIIRCGRTPNPADRGTFVYREGGEPGTPSVTAAGLIALFTRGLYKHPYVEPCTARIMETYKRAHPTDLTDSPIFGYYHFGCFYTSQALYLAGDSYWIPWFKHYVAALKTQQAANGALSDRHGNTVYPTAITALILQAPLGYMPFYLR